MRSDRSRSVLGAVGLALALSACAPKSALPSTAVPEAQRGSHAQAQRRGLEVMSLGGHVELDARAGYAEPGGDVFLHVFYLDGELFDGLLCFPRRDRCALVDLTREDTPHTWSATLSDSPSDTPPFVAYLDVPPDGDWHAASPVGLRIVAAELGEVGATTLTRDAAPPPDGVRERLRGEETLRRVYESIAIAYLLRRGPAMRVFPASHPEGPIPPPCGPTWVRDQAAVEWLGLTAPVVVSWAFRIETDPRDRTVRVIARRDRTCHGDIESLVLPAHVDEYGDLEHDEIESSADAPASPGGAQ